MIGAHLVDHVQFIPPKVYKAGTTNKSVNRFANDTAKCS